MRIALLAHVRHPVAPPFAGGMEALTWQLAAGLEARGHEVVLFASGDSDPRFRLDPVLPLHHERTFPGAEHRGDPGLVAHLDAGYAAALDRIAAGGFDVVHNNGLSRLPLERRRTARVPTVTSLHVPPYDALRWFVHDGPGPRHRLTVTSLAQRAAWWPDGAPPEVSVLHNGIDPAAWPYRETGDGSAVWCGRLAPEKGVHHAVAAARRAGLPLTLFGPVEDHGYFAERVRPALGGSVRYGGHLGAAALADAVGRASVLLFTPLWDEPFGLVAVEAMACGLPVAAFAAGAAREVVGEAGAFAPPGDEAALAAAIGRALAVPRAVARDRMLRLFTRDRWLDRCEHLYEAVRLGREPSREGPSRARIALGETRRDRPGRPATGGARMSATDMRDRTVAELVAAGVVAEADLDKSVQAYLDDHTIPKVHLGGGCVVDPGRAVEADAAARTLVARHDTAPDALRRAVRAAILAARPTA